MTDRLLDAAEVAGVLHVSTRWVRDATREGQLPCIRLGRQVRYRLDTIIEWVEGQESAKRAPASRKSR